MTFPKVISEADTIKEIVAGASIARFGDGEFKVVNGGNCVSQIKNAKLAAEMRLIAYSGSKKMCLVGIPPLDVVETFPEGKKHDFWIKQIPVTSKYINSTATYHSSFITRSDNAPWIDTKENWDGIVSLWKDKDVTLVLGSERSLCERNMDDAKSIEYVWCDRRDAYKDIDDIEKRIREIGNKTVILCLGCTATVLAWRLAGEFHALDLGHLGMKQMFKRGRGLI